VLAKRDNRWCLICQPKNRTLYWHKNEEGKIWCYCNKCDRGYSLEQYCDIADIDMTDFLTGDFHMQEAEDDTVQAMAWPSSFVPLSDPRAEKGVEYIKSRGLTLDGDMYYDLNEEGIVFPYYVENHFCGAQVRFIEQRVNEDGSTWKITTLPGTRLGLMFGMWNQGKLMPQIKAIVVCEGYFNAVSLQQAFNLKYGGISHNPWKFICSSGSGVSDHQAEALKVLKEQGYKVFGGFDTDEAGFKGLRKLIDANALTHFSSTAEVGVDWNDILQRDGYEVLAELFLANMQKV
jgi:hypothetical protein